MSKINPLSGFPELLPAQRTVEREVVASLSRTFELHGFANIETRVVEPIERLAKGGEIDKEIYVLQRIADTRISSSTTRTLPSAASAGALRSSAINRIAHARMYSLGWSSRTVNRASSAPPIAYSAHIARSFRVTSG